MQFYLKKYSGLTAFNLTSILWGKKITRQYLTQSSSSYILTGTKYFAIIKLPTSPGGGTGRRVRLRGVWAIRTGSSPVLGTRKKQTAFVLPFPRLSLRRRDRVKTLKQVFFIPPTGKTAEKKLGDSIVPANIRREQEKIAVYRRIFMPKNRNLSAQGNSVVAHKARSIRATGDRQQEDSRKEGENVYFAGCG